MDLVTIVSGRTSGLAADLQTNFETLVAGVEAVEALMREAIARLHGEGKEVGCVLAAGTGLVAVVGSLATDNAFWVEGERYEIADEDTPLTVGLEPNETNYIRMYVDEDGQPTLEAVLVAEHSLPSPIGKWFCGTASTDGSSVTTVDMTDAETVSAESMQAALAELNEWKTLAQAAIGEAYFEEEVPASSLDERVTAIEAGGGVDAETVKWGALDEAAGDTTKIRQAIQEYIDEHQEDYHGEEDPDGDEQLSYIVQEYDVVSANFGRSLLMLCRTVCPSVFTYLTDCVGIVWQVNGYDDIDWVNSTWTVTWS